MVTYRFRLRSESEFKIDSQCASSVIYVLCWGIPVYIDHLTSLYRPHWVTFNICMHTDKSFRARNKLQRLAVKINELINSRIYIYLTGWACNVHEFRTNLQHYSLSPFLQHQCCILLLHCNILHRSRSPIPLVRSLIGVVSTQLICFVKKKSFKWFLLMQPEARRLKQKARVNGES